MLIWRGAAVVDSINLRADCPTLLPAQFAGKSGPEFRDFVPPEPSKTIDILRPISENEGHDRHVTCPSLVHAHAAYSRRSGRGGTSSSQRPAAGKYSASAGDAAGSPYASRGPHCRAGGKVGSGRRPSGRVLRRDDSLDVYHAWDCLDLGLDDPCDYDCIVLLGWPDASNRERIKRIELYCRGGGSLVALRAMQAEIPGWSDFTEEVLGGRQPAGRKCGLLEVQQSEGAWHHPVVQGIETMIAEGEVYCGPRFSPDTTVLLTAGCSHGWHGPGQRMRPVAWTARHQGGRVFCTTLGLDDDFREPSFLRLISNAVHWTGLVHG